jgi:hypothetical protein
MQRIELRYCDVSLQDGLAGTAAVNQPTPVPAVGDTTLTLDSIVLNTNKSDSTRDTTLIPVGARFTIAGETTPTVHVVTARTPTALGPTTAITFTPALGAGTYIGTAVVTFAPQQLEIKIGEGGLKYSEEQEYHYDLNRGLLDDVRDGDEKPMGVDLDFTWQSTRSGTGESITPMEAIKGDYNAAEWVSSGDECQPYAVDLVVVYTPKCSVQKETYVFPAFRSEKRGPDFKDSKVSVSGHCNATEPIVTRG